GGDGFKPANRTGSRGISTGEVPAGLSQGVQMGGQVLPPQISDILCAQAFLNDKDDIERLCPDFCRCMAMQRGQFRWAGLEACATAYDADHFVWFHVSVDVAGRAFVLHAVEGIAD